MTACEDCADTGACDVCQGYGTTPETSPGADDGTDCPACDTTGTCPTCTPTEEASPRCA
jgi:hypothetical protein